MNLKTKVAPLLIEISNVQVKVSTNQTVQAFLYYLKRDWVCNPQRMIFEWVGMALAISASLVLSISIPEPPLAQILTTWIISSSILLGCALSRGSTGMVIFNAVLITIDLMGLIRLDI